jgi:hypothetical protein
MHIHFFFNFISFPDHVHFTTVGVRVPSLSQTNLLPKPMSPKKKPRDMRERAILNHAYANPQFHQSSGKILFVALVFNILHVPLFYIPLFM